VGKCEVIDLAKTSKSGIPVWCGKPAGLRRRTIDGQAVAMHVCDEHWIVWTKAEQELKRDN
jgi:hypothetical protein